MKSRIITPLISLIVLISFSYNVFSVNCPVCRRDTFNGEDCTNPSCGLNQYYPTLNNRVSGDKVIIPPGSFPGSGPIILPPMPLNPKVPITGSFSKDDDHAPQWLLTKSSESMRDTEGEMKWVPELEPLLKEVNKDKGNYEKIEPAQTSENISGLLLSHFQTANHAFIIVYTTPGGEETVQQIIVVAVNLAGFIYALSNVAEFWNTVTHISPEDIFEMIGMDSFNPDEENIVLYSYLQSLDPNSMPSITEGNENDEDAIDE